MAARCLGCQVVKLSAANRRAAAGLGGLPAGAVLAWSEPQGWVAGYAGRAVLAAGSRWARTWGHPLSVLRALAAAGYLVEGTCQPPAGLGGAKWAATFAVTPLLAALPYPAA